LVISSEGFSAASDRASALRVRCSSCPFRAYIHPLANLRQSILQIPEPLLHNRRHGGKSHAVPTVVQIDFDFLSGFADNFRGGVSMIFPALTTAGQLSRGLLAAIFALSGLYHGSPCCCSFLSCGETQENDCRSPLEDNEGCCCCQHSPDEDLTASSCCCSSTPPQSGNSCQGPCHCVQIPATEGIVATPERIEKREVKKDWLTDFKPTGTFPESIASVELRAEHQFRRDPCAHNQRQANLCVWRN
jgi:hypothetical protein